MKLYEVPRRTWVKVLKNENEGTKVPPAAPPIADDDIIFFDHVDGMYSYCKNNAGELCHLVCWQSVEILEPQPEAPA